MAAKASHLAGRGACDGVGVGIGADDYWRGEMSEMVERVAQAIAALKLEKIHLQTEPLWLERLAARAAIEAMREPTHEMLSAMWRCGGDGPAAIENWQDAIDEALK